MTGFQIEDWDAAYANGAYIPNGHLWPEAWVDPAAHYRSSSTNELDIAYGSHERQVYDLFLPVDQRPQGLLVFVHGGYWRALDKSYWSHLARGANDRSWAVAMPSYVLCPDVGIADIVAMVGECVVQAASRVDGPIVLSGHSAGGHIVTSLVCEDSPLVATVRDRVSHVVSISGVHDLRPLLHTAMNDDFRLTPDSARDLSPVLKIPVQGTCLTTWVGGAERAEFRRQSDLLANIWHGLGACTQNIEEPDKHHFDVIDGLARSDSPLMKTVMSIFPDPDR